MITGSESASLVVVQQRFQSIYRPPRGYDGKVRLGFSPLLPTVASLLLAALWGLSVFGGWGVEAFCAGGGSPSSCSERYGAVSAASVPFAVAAAVCTLAAWFRREGPAFGFLIGAGVACWVVAEGVLFFGGMLVQS